MKIIGNNKQLFKPCRGKHHCPRNEFVPMCVIAVVGKCFPEVKTVAPTIVHSKPEFERQQNAQEFREDRAV
ncbi:hypothetical protein GQ457_09G010770 [Hibiscus cannabinus]